MIRQLIRLFRNPLPVLQTPQNLHRQAKNYKVQRHISYHLNLLQYGIKYTLKKKKNIKSRNTHKAIHTHSKERIQQPRAMPNKILRVRRGLPDTTWVVLSHTLSTTVKPPRFLTSWKTTSCFLNTNAKHTNIINSMFEQKVWTIDMQIIFSLMSVHNFIQKYAYPHSISSKNNYILMYKHYCNI